MYRISTWQRIVCRAADPVGAAVRATAGASVRTLVATLVPLVPLVLLAAGSALVAPAAAQQVLRDSLFAVERTEGIVYATMQAGDPPADVDLLLDLYEPSGDAPVPRPGCIIVHGAGSYRGRPLLVRFASAMAGRGYVAISINYRDTVPDPQVSPEFQPYLAALVDSFPTSPGLDVWAANTEDVTVAYRWMVEQSAALDIDPTRIVLGGISRGATLSLNVGYVIDDYGVTLDPPLRAVWEQAGTVASYVDHIATGEPAIIIIHGTADQIVHFDHGLGIRDRVHHVGVPYDFYAVEGAGHFIDLFQVRPGEGLSPFQRIVQFFYFFVGPPVPVELTSFVLEPGVAQVILHWSVSPASDPVGFDVLRAPVDDRVPPDTGRFVRLNPEPVTPLVPGGRRFRFDDATVVGGVTYDYRLRATDRAGETRSFELGHVAVPHGAPPPAVLDVRSPNPLGAATPIAFELAAPTLVRLTVHDVAGRTVRVLVDRRLGGGRHQLTWDGRDDRGRSVAPGVYLLELLAGARPATRKVVLTP